MGFSRGTTNDGDKLSMSYSESEQMAESKGPAAQKIFQNTKDKT